MLLTTTIPISLPKALSATAISWLNQETLMWVCHLILEPFSKRNHEAIFFNNISFYLDGGLQ
jgi:hypothetical protein